MNDYDVSSEPHRLPWDRSTRKPWKPKVSGFIGFFFGPVAAALVTFSSLRALGDSRRANWILGLTLTSAAALGSLAYWMSEEAFDSIAWIFGNLLSPFLYPPLQRIAFDDWRARNPAAKPREGWRAIGLGLVGTFLLLVFFAVGLMPWVLMESVDDVEVWVTLDSNIEAGREFVIQIDVKSSSEATQVLDSLDLDEAFLQGIEIRKTEPRYLESERQPFGEIRSFRFEQPIPPMGEATLKLFAVAPEAGSFESEVAFCIDTHTNCIYHYLTLSVQGAEPPKADAPS